MRCTSTKHKLTTEDFCRIDRPSYANLNTKNKGLLNTKNKGFLNTKNKGLLNTKNKWIKESLIPSTKNARTL